MLERRRIRDPIHNLIRFSFDKSEDILLWKLIETPAFQRLRHIKQLGFSDYVYPGATHSRFSHSLGVMEMARKMMDAIERNQPEIKNADNYELERKAALCAALLHDIGHGPFSHVFEEISKNFDISERHESYTKSFINSNPIKGLLEKESLLDRVLSFFDDKTKNRNLFGSIVSDQIDADRLDFLQRDKYFTGIRFGSIDVDWILDSLKLLKSPHYDEDGEFSSLCFDKKGIRALEEYFSSYVKIYIDVYFHKTTRSVQHLFSNALYAIINDRQALASQGINSLAFDYFDAKNPSERLKIYPLLIDGALIQLIGKVARNGTGDAQKLARRFMKRELYKSIEFSAIEVREWPSGTSKAFETALKRKNVWFVKDQIPPKGLKQYSPREQGYLKNVQIGTGKDGENYSIAKFSTEIRTYTGHSPLRYYFYNNTEKNKAKRIFSNLPGLGNIT